jgi:hypothetical protein
MTQQNPVMQWLLQGDPAIRWQTQRDLLGADEAVVQAERQQIATTGWGAKLLSYQEPSGLWGGGLYSPKWISTTYTMLLLRRLGLDPNHSQAQQACQLLLDKGFYVDGGINFFRSFKHSETCVTGMVLSILAYFNYQDERVAGLVEHLLGQQMADGGWNCESYKGASHSSFHTTISVLEGLREYERRWSEPSLTDSQNWAVEFLLIHRLFRSHRTSEVVDARMTRFSFPPRWRYDVMRVLDYFQERNVPPDPRMADAIGLLKKKRRPDGTWVLQNKHPGRVYFELEKVGQPSRWNTLRALRIRNWHEAFTPTDKLQIQSSQNSAR